MKQHEKAVYGTRPFHTFGYGTAEIHEGHFGGQSATIQYSASDIRFTTSKDQKHVYAFSLGQPEAGSSISLKEVLTEDKEIASVSLVANGTPVKWEVQEGKVVLEVPAADKTDPIATVFDIEFK
ncbi:MAG: alpha-L-fucosidase C-terminal domain-containing protein [Bacteroidota bacterium]